MNSMFLINNFLLATILIIALPANYSFAKGLDEISKQENEPPAAESDGEEQEEQSKPDKDKKKSAKALKKVAELPKELDKKLSIATGFGWLKTVGSIGDWQSTGMSDITISYLIGPAMNGDLYAHLRYAPYDVYVQHESISYRGSVNAYNLGAMNSWELASGLTVQAAAELGLLIVNLYDITDFSSDKELESNGINLNLGGSAEWNVMEHTYIGPKMFVGVGRLTTFQLSLNIRLLL